MPGGRYVYNPDDFSTTPVLDAIAVILGLVTIAGGSLAVVALIGYASQGKRGSAVYDAVIIIVLIIANALLHGVRWHVHRQQR